MSSLSILETNNIYAGPNASQRSALSVLPRRNNPSLFTVAAYPT